MPDAMPLSTVVDAEASLFEHEIRFPELQIRFRTHSHTLYEWISSYYEAADARSEAPALESYVIHFEETGSKHALALPEPEAGLFTKFCLVGDAHCYLASDKFYSRQTGMQEHQIVVDPINRMVQGNIGGCFLLSEETFIYVVLRDVLRRLVLPLSGCIVLHGSVVMRGAVTIFFAGDSGMGKSTIALEMIKHGFQIISDDSPIALFDKGKACVSSGRDQFSVTENTMRLFPELLDCVSRRRDVSGKFFLSRVQLGDARTSYEARKITHFVELRRGAFDACALVPIDKSDCQASVIREFMPLFHKSVQLVERPQLMGKANMRMFDLLSQLLSGAKTFELQFGDAHRCELPALLIGACQ